MMSNERGIREEVNEKQTKSMHDMIKLKVKWSESKVETNAKTRNKYQQEDGEFMMAEKNLAKGK